MPSRDVNAATRLAEVGGVIIADSEKVGIPYVGLTTPVGWQ